MNENKITFDQVIRWILLLAGSVGIVLLTNRLSSVLLPFFIAWLLAYMLYPLVHFIQYKLRFPGRVLSIVAAILFVLGAIAGIVALILPPLMEEMAKLRQLVSVHFHDTPIQAHVSNFIGKAIREYADGHSVFSLLRESNFVEAIQSAMVQLWELVSGTLSVALGVLGFFVVLLYMFFILMDYEKLSNDWTRLIPSGKRKFASMIVHDVKNGMNAYFRGQALIAFFVGILFSIGFLIIDFPMAIGLGLFIGFLNLVPYLQTIGFVPTILLALLKAADTGQNFWLILLMALAVFVVVQLIQDLYLTPRIMGKAMGLKPAVILLSLSVWGSLLGIIGIIIALPLTTLLLSYYRRYVLKEE